MTTNLIERRETPSAARVASARSPRTGDAPASRTLNPVDRMMLAAHQSVRRMGGPGIINQTIIELAGRADADALRRAVAELSRRYPVLAARLIPDAPGRRARWAFRDAACPLHERDLPTADRETLLAAAADIMAVPADLEHEDPASFHVLHRPDGRDALLIRSEHALMDTSLMDALVSELDALSRAAPGPSPSAEAAAPWEIRDFLRRSSILRRLRTVLSLVLQPPAWSLRPARTICDEPTSVPPAAAGPSRIVVREIPADALAATAARTAKSCGYPAISLGLLASILRAIDALAPRPPHARDHFLVHVGMDLRPQIAGNRVDPDRPLPLSLGNIATVIPVTARRTDMTDRDAFVRFLARQFRDRVRRGWDVALVQLMTVYTRWMWVARRLTRALFRRSQSLNYGCFHSTLPAGATLATVPIVAMYHLSSAPAPPGLALIATRFQRRMILAATHDPAVVPRERADALLDQLIADFCDAGAPPEAPP